MLLEDKSRVECLRRGIDCVFVFVLLDYLRAHVSSGLTVTVTIHDVRPQGESYFVRAERISAEIKSRWTGSEASS